MRWRENPLWMARFLLCLFFLVRAALATDSPRPVRTFDLKGELCDLKLQQLNGRCGFR